MCQHAASRVASATARFRACMCVAVAFIVLTPSTVLAQGRTVPSDSYYLALATFHAGEYKTALRGFRQAARSGVIIGNLRWVDGICYHAMTAECYYHLGQLALALEEHEKALGLYRTQADFLSQVQLSPALTTSNSAIRATITWAPGRVARLGFFPRTMLVSQGSIDQYPVIERGGVVNPAHYRRLDVSEVVRCLGLSLRRRNELLGPAARYSPLSSRLVGLFSAQLVPARHWANAWTEVLFGLALLGDGAEDEAISHLAGGVLAGGFDHPLTGTALLELGKLALRKGDYIRAGEFLLQATLAGAEFEQADLVEEAFRLLTDAHLAARQPTLFPAVDRAIAYARRNDFHRLHASLLLSASEIAVYKGQPQSATYLEQAKLILARRAMVAGDIGGRFSYLGALVAYQGGNVVAGNESMATAMAYMNRSSLRLFQRRSVDALYTSKAVKPRIADRLYDKVLREPSDVDWATEPMETIAELISPHTKEIEHWFEALLQRKDHEKGLAVSELLRRHRFYSSLPMGGRLLALRWLTEGDRAMLGKTGAAQGAALRDKYPQLKRLSQQTKQLQDALRAGPAMPTDDEQIKLQRNLSTRLSKVSTAHDALIREMALRRDPSKLVFPPQASLEPIQRAMRGDEAILAFITSTRHWHAYLIRKNGFENWSIRSPRNVRSQVTKLLRALGNNERSSLTVKNLDDTAWQAPAAELWTSLIGQLPSDMWDTTRQLVIIPDGILWYLPFEILQAPTPAGTESLFSRVQIRYAPTASLSTGDRRGRDPGLKNVFVGGRIPSRTEDGQVQPLFESLQKALPGIEAVSAPPTAPSSLLARNWDRLIVWDDIEEATRGPYAWSPAQVEPNKQRSSLADWMALPWGAPDQIILPGFHTAAEKGARGRKATGHEVFLSVCGLMSTGVRTALLSRWPVGGGSAAALVREFVQELPTETASAAWQRSVELARASEFDPKAEPRIKATATDDMITADHPYFWSGYMLVDTGAQPQVEKVEEKEAPPAAPE